MHTIMLHGHLSRPERGKHLTEIYLMLIKSPTIKCLVPVLLKPEYIFNFETLHAEQFSPEPNMICLEQTCMYMHNDFIYVTGTVFSN